MVLKLELCIVVQLLHISTTGFWFDIEEKERQKKKQTKICNSSSNHNNINNNKKRLRMVLILILYYDRRASKARYTIVINAKIKQYILSMVITLDRSV